MKKKIGLLTLALIVTFTMIGCDEGVSPQLVFNSYAEVETGEITTEHVVGSERTDFLVGEHVAIGDYVMVLNGFSESEGQTWDKPSNGNQFVNFDITIHNVSTELRSISSLFVFEVRDSSGKGYGSILSKEDLPRLDGYILPGGTLNGIVSFEIPYDALLETLIFDYSLFSTGQVTFDLLMDSQMEPIQFEGTVAEYKQNSIGDVLLFEALVYKVMGYRTSQGSADYQAKDGYVYLIFEISVDNIATQTQTLDNRVNFTLQCENGYNYPIVFAPDLKGSLKTELAAGKSHSAEIAFEVPAGTLCNLILVKAGALDNFYVVGR